MRLHVLAVLNNLECLLTSFTRKVNKMICVFYRSVLIQHGLVCTIRESRGDDEMAACGQLGVDQDRKAPILKVPLQFEKALIAH